MSNTDPTTGPQWRRSSYCANGACLEVGADWTRSSYCASGSCVECRANARVVFVRDSKLDDSPVLAFPVETWRRFVTDLKEDRLSA